MCILHRTAFLLVSIVLVVENDAKATFTYNTGILSTVVNRIDCEIGDGLKKLNFLKAAYLSGALKHNNSVKEEEQDADLVSTLFSLMSGMGNSISWIGLGFDNSYSMWYYTPDSIFYPTIPSKYQGRVVSPYIAEVSWGFQCNGSFNGSSWNVPQPCMRSYLSEADTGEKLYDFSAFPFNVTGRPWYPIMRRIPVMFSSPYTYSTPNTNGPVVVIAGCTAIYDQDGVFIGAGNFATDVSILSTTLKSETAQFSTLELFYIFEIGDGYKMLACEKDGVVTNASSQERFSAIESSNPLIRASSRRILEIKNSTGSYENATGVSLLYIDSNSIYYMQFGYTTGIGEYPFMVAWGTVVLEAVNCPEGYFLDNTTLTCQKCVYPYSSKGGTSECVICAEKFYLDGSKCKSCPHDATCKAGTTLDSIDLSTGTWRWPESTEIVHCLPEAYCLGGNGTNPRNEENPYCAPHHLGPFCVLCENGFQQPSPEAMCEACAKDSSKFMSKNPWLVPVVVVLVLLAMCSGYAFMFLYTFLHEFLEILGNMMNDDKPHGILKRLANKLKIVFVCIQIVVNCIYSLDVEYPKEVTDISKSLSNAMALAPTSVIPIDCMADTTKHAYWLELRSVTILPLLLLAAVWAYYTIRKQCTPHQDDKDRYQRSMVANIVALLFIIVPSTSNTVLNTFNVEYTNGEDLEYAFLAVDYSTKINSSIYRNVMQPYALLCVFIYPIGIPCFFLCLLRANLDQIDPVVERPQKVENTEVGEETPKAGRGRQYNDDTHMMKAVETREVNPTISHLGFLINTYEPQFWYWEIFVTCYRILITNVHIISKDYSVILVFITALAYWKFVSYYAPFTYDSDDFLADLCQGIVVLTLLMGIMIQQLGCPVYFNYIFVAMVIVLVFYMIMIVLVDTLEERTYFWVNRKGLARAITSAPRHYIEYQKEVKANKGVYDSDL